MSIYVTGTFQEEAAEWGRITRQDKELTTEHRVFSTLQARTNTHELSDDHQAWDSDKQWGYCSAWDNEVFARKEEQKEIGQLEHNKLRRLHQLYVSHL